MDSTPGSLIRKWQRFSLPLPFYRRLRFRPPQLPFPSFLAPNLGFSGRRLTTLKAPETLLPPQTFRLPRGQIPVPILLLLRHLDLVDMMEYTFFFILLFL